MPEFQRYTLSSKTCLKGYTPLEEEERGGEGEKEEREGKRERERERERERDREKVCVSERGQTPHTIHTCIAFKSMIAKLLTVLMVAVAIDRVELVRGGGDEECLGGPSCSRMA